MRFGREAGDYNQQKVTVLGLAKEPAGGNLCSSVGYQYGACLFCVGIMWCLRSGYEFGGGRSRIH